MEKKIYYILSFILVTFSIFLIDSLNNMDILKMSSQTIIIICFLLSAIIANFTPTHRRFDYIITIIMPLSLLCAIVLIDFFAGYCDGRPKFYLRDAFYTAFDSTFLQLYLTMGAITFLASFRPFRLFRIIKRKTRDS